jgi:hypothetical protein
MMMKQPLLTTLILLLLVSGFTACSKNEAIPLAGSSLTIVNAIPGGAAIVAGLNAATPFRAFNTAQQVAAYGYKEYAGYTGETRLTFTQMTDTTQPFYNTVVNLGRGSVQTLFLSGTVKATDSVFTTDLLPVISLGDSTIGLRFINLVSGSAPISINVQGNTAQPLVASLAYKSVTPFMLFNAKKADPASASYVFEIRNATTGVLITSYTLSGLTTRLRKSGTLAFKGMIGGTGTNAQGTMLVNHY